VSDFYQDPVTRAARQAEETRRTQIESGSDPVTRAAEAARPIQQHFDSLRRQYADLPPAAAWEYEKYDRLLPIVAASEDPEAVRNRLNDAFLFSKILDKPIEDTYLNLETYHEQWLGKAYVPKTATKGIADSFAMGIASMEYNLLGARLKARGGSDPDTEAKLAENRQKIERLQDNVPRPWYIEAVKFGAQSLPYTAIAIGAGALTGGIASAALGSAAVSGGVFAAVKAGASMAGSAAASFAMMEGAEYADLRAAGVRHDIAAPLSGWSALFQAAVETALGNVAGAGAKLLKNAAPNITRAFTKRLFISGKIGALGMALGGYAGEAVEEGAEEVFQTLVSAGFQNLAADIQEEGGVEKKSAEKIAGEVLESFKGGFLSSLIMGAPSSIADYRGTVQDSRRLAELARTLDEDAFKKTAREMRPSVLEGIGKEQREAFLSDVWKAQQARKAQGVPEAAEEETEAAASAARPTPFTPGPARRGDDGTLRMEIRDRQTVTPGIEEGRLTIGSPNGDFYGGITFREDGDTVVIDKVDALQYLTDREDVIYDAVMELAANYPGSTIEWDTPDPELARIRDRIIGENPRGPEAGLQHFEPDVDIAETREAAGIRDAVTRTFTNLSQREVRAAVSLVYQTARSLGFNPQDVIGKSLNLYTRAELTADPDLARQISAGNRRAKNETGGTFFTRDGKTVTLPTAAREFEQGIKGVIYAAENADFSTFAHEWFHFIDTAYIGRSSRHRQLFEQALDKHYDQITYQEKEKLARNFEQYLKDGIAPTTGLKALFRRMANAMARALNAVKRVITLSPELRRAYDSLFMDEKTQLARDARISQSEFSKILAAQRGDLSKNINDGAPEIAENPDGNTRREFAAYAGDAARKYRGEVIDRAPGRKVLSLPDEASVYRAMRDLVNRPEVIRAEDGYLDGNGADMVVNVRLSNNDVAEIRLNTRERIEAARSAAGETADPDANAGANAGTVSQDNPSVLYQLTDDDVLENARRFASWEEWKKDEEEINAAFGPEHDLSGGLTGAEADAWYKAKWEEARDIRRDEQGRETGDTPAMTTEEINERFIEDMESGDRLNRFLERIYYALSADLATVPRDAEEARARDAADALADRIRAEMHPTVINNAIRIGMGRELTESSRKRILTDIEKGAAHYRELYTEITGDSVYAALAENEIKTMPEIRDPEGRTLSIVEMEKIARRIKSREIREKILNGTIVPDDIRFYITALEEERDDIKSRLRAKENELAEDERLLTALDRAYLEKKTEVQKAEDTIRDYELEIVDLEKNLEKLRNRINKNKARAEKKEAAYAEQLAKVREARDAKRAELAELRQASREAMGSARAQAVLQKRMALNKLREKIRETETERREAARIITYKRKLLHDIMKEPGKGVWYEYRRKIRAIQDTIDPMARRATVKWEGELYTIQQFMDRAVEENLIDILPKNLVKRLFKKSLDEWTVAELEEMRNEINGLISTGRTIWAVKENERKMAVLRTIKEGMSQNYGNKKYTEAFAAGSLERNEQLKKLDSLFKAAVNATWTLSRIANWIDDGKDGVNTRLLVTEEREAYKAKMDNYDRRIKRVNDFMKNKKMTVLGLYEKQFTMTGTGSKRTDVTYTASDLMYMYIGLRDPNTRDAIIYGNFMDQGERSTWPNDHLKKIGEDKLRYIQNFVNANLSADEKALANEIAQDFRDEFGRLNDVFANEFNIVMRQVSSYVPMIRQDVTASGEEHEQRQAQEILNVAGTSIKRTPDRGFTVKRITIAPRNQRAIQLDLYGTWMQAAERQEHFAAYTPYIRKLNGVYKNTGSSESRAYRHQLTQIYGPEVMRRIDLEINALANPQSFRNDRNISRLLRAFRGNLAAAYLGFRVSSVLKQFATSPAPFLAYVNPLDMTKSALAFIRSPREFSDSVKSKSAIMRHRQADPIIAEIRKARETSKGKKGLAAVQDIGMMGLEAADWVSVSIGWNAVYERSLTEGLSEKDAIAKADDVVLKSQPSAREQDLAALYKTRHPAMQLLTQFTTAMNVIWNQFTYDLPTAIKQRNYRFAVGMITGYAIAGGMLGLLVSGIRGGDDDDDDINARRFIYYATSQFFESVPIIGNAVSALAEFAITGERPRLYQASMLPAADELINAAKNITSGDWDKAASHAVSGAFLGTGLPLSGIKELGRAAGIGDDDGFNPEALLGRRK
jgi:predicted  nucleic acid-binding Zn-ribbon protein